MSKNVTNKKRKELNAMRCAGCPHRSFVETGVDLGVIQGVLHGSPSPSVVPARVLDQRGRLGQFFKWKCDGHLWNRIGWGRRWTLVQRTRCYQHMEYSMKIANIYASWSTHLVGLRWHSVRNWIGWRIEWMNGRINERKIELMEVWMQWIKNKWMEQSLIEQMIEWTNGGFFEWSVIWMGDCLNEFLVILHIHENRFKNGRPNV